jgi:hypothetical protein
VGKGVCTFKEADVTRAFKAAKKAGVDVQVEIDLERKRMRITPVKAGNVNGANEWDEVLDNGDDQASLR